MATRIRQPVPTKTTKTVLITAATLLALCYCPRISAFSSTVTPKVPHNLRSNRYQFHYYNGISGYTRRNYNVCQHHSRLFPAARLQPAQTANHSRREASLRETTTAATEEGGATRKWHLGRLKPQSKRQMTYYCLAIILIVLGALYRPELPHYLGFFHNCNQLLGTYLDRLDKAGPAGLLLYTALLWIWTMTVGITTPIETTAGFCFGAKRAIWTSSCGKIGGALTVFLLGRYVFYDKAQQKLGNNDTLQLVKESISEHPFLVGIMTRLTPMPELVKNFGMSALDLPVKYFSLSLFLHGFLFTCLWSWMGAETAKVALHGGAPSAALKAMVTGMTWFGGFLSPTLIAWWLRDLRKKRAARRAQEEEQEQEVGQELEKEDS